MNKGSRKQGGIGFGSEGLGCRRGGDRAGEVLSVTSWAKDPAWNSGGSEQPQTVRVICSGGWYGFEWCVGSSEDYKVL